MCQITKNNLSQAIGALRQCAKENENKTTDTGCIRISDLCNDVATYLEKELEDMKQCAKELEQIGKQEK